MVEERSSEFEGAPSVFVLGPSEYILIVLVIAALYIIARRSANMYRATANKKAA
jgi:hypothetical protein